MHIPKEHTYRKRLDEEAEELVFAGYSAESKAFRLFDTSSDKIRINRDIGFLVRILTYKPLENDIKIKKK